MGIFCAAETDPAHMGKIPTPPSPGTDGIWRGYFGLATSAAVADAYGWPADLPDAEMLERLLGLNLERAGAETNSE